MKNQTTKTNTLSNSSARLIKPRLAFVILSLLCIAPLAHSQTATQPDLDRDGIPNISDPDVDNDGILNGADRNIDGGTSKSGPLRGRIIGDNLLNNSPLELDMDADGLADDATNETDIDGDGLPDSDVRETDIDGDGLPDSDVRETDIDGDGLLDNATNETDIDGDSLLDNSQSETDIDGDGLLDGAKGEVDIDGDGTANGLDQNMDGDNLANNADPDMDGSGIDDLKLDILYEFPGNPPLYADDASVAPAISFVSAEVRKALQIPANDMGLRVRVQAGSGTGDQPGLWGNYVTGVWRYFSADRIQVWAKWCYPVSNPSQLKIFVQYSYTGPYSGNPADYTNPANYVVSDENRLYSGYATGKGEFSLMRTASSPNVFLSWLPGNPVGFFYTAPNEQATGFAPPYDPLKSALGSLPNFSSSREYLDFSGDLTSSSIFSGVQPILGLLRTIRQVNLNWYGQLEAQQIR
jgi:hypothetical protein